MAKIKLTKNELKGQRDGLKRFSRYLPTLQLKKQQLQLEVQRTHSEYNRQQQEMDRLLRELNQWIRLLDQPAAEYIGQQIKVVEWKIGQRNVAGVDVEVFEKLECRREHYDLFAEPLWYDEVINMAQEVLEHRLRLQLLDEQRKAIEEELLTTTQRVNLFEKVKIPEARENIRKIQIFLGDQQVAAVGRAKTAKRKTQELQS